MKMNWCLCLGLMLATGVLAQTLTNAPPASPATAPTPAAGESNAPATLAPATGSLSTNAPTGTATNTNAHKASAQKKAAKKKSSTKQAAKKKPSTQELHTIPLVAGQAVVIASNVNVRGQAKLNSEVITKVTKGQTVSVLEEVNLKKSGPDEPSAWAKIILPAGTHVWVNGKFVDPATMLVTSSKLKIRGGPGENYSVLGIVKKGDELKQLNAKGEWMEVEAPAEANGFIAAQYLKQEEPTLLTSTTSNTVVETAQVPVAPTENTNSVPGATNDTTIASNTNTQPTPVVEEPPPRRIVQREGIVRGTFSIQAPTRFELISPDNRKAINYLYTTAPDLDLARYKGMHIIVTGEEGLDERWHNTPIITIQRIQVLE
jgi:uncharacterized protein YgiM (DUF1202 family)